jgi:starvation-inducible outer membrane lipoprotein
MKKIAMLVSVMALVLAGCQAAPIEPKEETVQLEEKEVAVKA